MSVLFYRPEGAWAGDFIPFYRDGKFRLFYLHDWRNSDKYGEGVSWYQVSTGDFVNFTEYGEMLSRGKKDEQDLYVFTGSMIESNGLFHIFYTGHNPYLVKEGKNQEAVMHAVSKNLLQWKKIPADTFFARQDIYEANDWRDPFVFWNERDGKYWMLLAARLKSGPPRRRGCTALCTSKDLKKWEVHEPFWAPNLYFTHECPDLFRMGEWWYLVYSTFSERSVTHYRMSKSLKGPWTAPENDTFDGRAFYAAKTASDGRGRFVFGWNPTRENGSDSGNWNWGGNLVVHEIVQQPDGSLSVRVPKTIDMAFSKELNARFSPCIGKWQIKENQLMIDAEDSFACAVGGDMPDRCKISVLVSFGRDTRGCGIMLKVSDDFEKAYYIRLETGRNRLVFDSWPRDGDKPYLVELERPIDFSAGKQYELKVFVDNTICEVYANGKVAMSARLYNLKEGKWGVFVSEGSAKFTDAKISILP